MAVVNLPAHNLTFIHVPKSAGSSVVSWMKVNFPEHERVQGHPSLPMVRQYWDVKRSFAIVRNPWSRFVSMYFYLKQYGFYWKENNITCEDDFPSWNDFIEKMDYTTASWNTLSTNQAAWLEGGVDFLFKAETLSDDFIAIQNLLNCHAPLPYINTSAHDDYRMYYSESQRNRIAKVFEQDIDLYRYAF